LTFVVRPSGGSL